MTRRSQSPADLPSAGLPPGADAITRRGFLTRTAALALAAPFATTACATPGTEVTIRLAAGEKGGFYHAFAQLLARTAATTGLRIEPLTTAGSLDNLALLARGDADTALILADSLEDNPDPPQAIGRVYENYLQLAVATDSPLHTVADLRGTRINLGSAGSGATRTGEKLLRAADLDPTQLTITHLPLQEAATALTTGTLDALLWAGGVPTPALTTPALRLLDLGTLTTPMRNRFGYLYDPVLIPAGTYPASPASPAIHTIGVANLLVATPTLPDDTATALTDVLLRHADSLVPTEAAGTQFLDARSLIGTGSIPLHPGAAHAYRTNHG
ncbi:TAXI family TRAP transporter solute-binding subunit [Nocardia sp. 2]|uniref:TAXI family TRAP transporter solute-binding subunit n=1 Tax=Nocardia acididurans TaxID=2802282 RepID=A0ABS1M8K7_9NOCA|nr:TAXI family TRAP transporter solute-binding subunit [Nocardia acididurans]MBL1076987.1 TAXI family TRAP transporter solute-binding subunit [Nocardia acididurans]